MSDVCELAQVASTTHLVLRGAPSLPDLEGILDVARAAVARETALVVDLTQVRHLHAGCVQILIALRRSVEARGLEFSVRTSDGAGRALALAGLVAWCGEPS